MDQIRVVRREHGPVGGAGVVGTGGFHWEELGFVQCTGVRHMSKGTLVTEF